MARPTIDDIARQAGVSTGAVSFALNGRPGVSASTRAKIIAVADEMNWRPHRAARALGRSLAGAVGLVLSRPARTLGIEPFFAQLISGLQTGLSERGIALQLLIVDGTSAEMDAYRSWTAERRVDGFILVDLLVEDPRLELLEQLEVPVVAVGGPIEQRKLSFTWADDREAMLRVVEYLAALGHRRILHVAGMPQFQHTRRRMEPLAESAARLGLVGSTSIPTDFSDSEGAAVTRELLSSPSRPSAVIYDSDVMAVAGLGVALEMGVRVPADLSIVSFDDSLLTRLTHPALTALTRDTHAWGVDAARLLIAAIDEPGHPQSHQWPTPRLVVRESTAMPNADWAIANPLQGGVSL